MLLLYSHLHLSIYAVSLNPSTSCSSRFVLLPLMIFVSGSFFFLTHCVPAIARIYARELQCVFFFASFFRGIFLWWLLTIIVTITCHNKKKCARRKGHRTRTHTHIKQNEMTNKEINAKMINFGDTKRACRERRILMASFFGW